MIIHLLDKNQTKNELSKSIYMSAWNNELLARMEEEYDRFNTPEEDWEEIDFEYQNSLIPEPPNVAVIWGEIIEGQPYLIIENSK